MTATSILLTPARIGAVEIPNRIVMPPMTTRTADEAGHVTEDTLAYYLARAQGGVGLITVEMASPERAGRHRRREIGIYDDGFLPGASSGAGRSYCGVECDAAERLAAAAFRGESALLGQHVL